MDDFSACQMQVDGRIVQYYTAGSSGSPVVLLHGGGTDSATLSWRLLLPALGRHHRVFAPDWPGYGGSQKFRAQYSFELMVAWLGDVLDQWGLESASLVGISMGGGGALAFTLANPSRVESLVLVDSYGIQRRTAYHRLGYWMVRSTWLLEWTWSLVRRSRRMARWSLGSIFADPKNISEELVDEVFAAVQNPAGQRAFYEFQRAEMLPDRVATCFMDRLGELRLPVMIVHGRQDSLVPLADAEAAARRIEGARLEVIDGAGHWPMREKPDYFNRLVIDFLSTTSKGRVEGQDR